MHIEHSGKNKKFSVSKRENYQVICLSKLTVTFSSATVLTTTLTLKMKNQEQKYTKQTKHVNFIQVGVLLL